MHLSRTDSLCTLTKWLTSYCVQYLIEHHTSNTDSALHSILVMYLLLQRCHTTMQGSNPINIPICDSRDALLNHTWTLSFQLYCGTKGILNSASAFFETTIANSLAKNMIKILCLLTQTIVVVRCSRNPKVPNLFIHTHFAHIHSYTFFSKNLCHTHFAQSLWHFNSNYLPRRFSKETSTLLM